MPIALILTPVDASALNSMFNNLSVFVFAMKIKSILIININLMLIYKINLLEIIHIY
jgi:hypothetical protein